MTQTQQRIYDAITEYKKNNGYEPNEYELARLTNYNRLTVRRALAYFEKEGLLTKQKKRGQYELSPGS